jgi:hypothetical protein
MEFSTFHRASVLRLALGLGCLMGRSSFAGTQLWSEMGGGFGGDATHVGIVGQESAAGQADRMAAGFLVHPLFLNAAPIAQDTSIQTTSDSVTFAVPGADLDGSVLSGRVVAGPHHGTASFSGLSLAYAATSGYVGLDSVGFVVLDNQGLNSDTAWARIQVEPTTSLRPRNPLVLPVGSPDVKVRRYMASLSTNEGRGGLAFSRDLGDESGLALTLLVANPSSVDVQIYDNIGTLVTTARTDLDASSLNALPRTPDGRRELVVRWDLRDRAGHPVAEGVYLWRVVILTADGQKLETVRKTGVNR